MIKRLTPFNWEDEDLYDMVFTEKRLDRGSETVLDTGSVLSPSECYQICLNEDKIFCSSFSFCKADGNCRLSSFFVDAESTNSQEDVEKGTATNCNVYRRGAIKLFDKNPGLTAVASGDKTVDKVVSADQCAMSCQQEKGFKCKGFEFCDTTRTCVLHKTHALDSPPMLDNKPVCSHYSLKYGPEFADMGELELVGDKSASITVNRESFENCSKTCYENSVIPCRSFDYCPGASLLSSSCVLWSATSTTKGFDLNTSTTCSHFFRRSEMNIIPDVVIVIDPKNRVGSGRFAGTIIGVMIFGIFLGAGGFILYSLYRSRHQSADGHAVRFINSRGA